MTNGYKISMESSAVWIVCVILLFTSSFRTTIAQSSEIAFPKHTIHLVLNQDKYLAGETISVKGYFLDRNRKGVEGKHLMSIFLVDDHGVCRQTIRFNLLGGIGHNQLKLTDSLAVGFYNVVGYVNPIEDQSLGYITSRSISVIKGNAITSLDVPPQTPGRYDSVAVSSGPVAVAVEKDTFGKRQKVKLDVVTRNSQGTTVSAEFSVTVFNTNLGMNHTHLFLLDGAIVGEGNRYFQVNERSPIQPEQKALGPLSRFNVFQKTGKVIHAETGEPVSNNTQVLFYLQRAEWYHQTFTVNGGAVRLNLPQFTGTDELLYLAETPREKIIPVKVQWDMQELPQFTPAAPSRELDFEDSYATFVKNTRVIQQSYQTFLSEGQNEPAIKKIEEFDMVEPDDIYRPETYVTFQTMAEMILEVIPAMYHRKNGDTEIVRITLPDPMTSTTDPVYFINGRATTSTKYFLSINPSDIEYIGVVKDPKKLKPLRLLGKNGIVIVKSKPGKVTEPAEHAEQFQGLNPVVPFHKSQPSDMPDFRSTILWEPTIVTDRNGRASLEFFTTDDVGEMTIQLEGITSNGQPFLYRTPIAVK